MSMNSNQQVRVTAGWSQKTRILGKDIDFRHDGKFEPVISETVDLPAAALTAEDVSDIFGSEDFERALEAHERQDYRGSMLDLGRFGKMRLSQTGDDVLTLDQYGQSRPEGEHVDLLNTCVNISVKSERKDGTRHLELSAGRSLHFDEDSWRTTRQEIELRLAPDGGVSCVGESLSDGFYFSALETSQRS